MSKRDTVGSGDDMSGEDTDVSEEVTDRNKKKSKPHQPAAQSEKRRNPATSQRKVSPGSGKSNPASGSGGNGGAKDNRPRNSHHSTSDGGSSFTVNSDGRQVSVSSSSASSGKGKESHGGTSTSQQGRGDRGGGATSNSDSHDGAHHDYGAYSMDHDGFFKRERDNSMQQLRRYKRQFSEDSDHFQAIIVGCVDNISTLTVKHKDEYRALEQECGSLDISTLPLKKVVALATKYNKATLGLIEETRILKKFGVSYRLRGDASLQPDSAVDSTAAATSPGDNGAGSGALGPAQEAMSTSAPENFTVDQAENYLKSNLICDERQKYKKSLEDHQQILSRFVAKFSGVRHDHQEKRRALEREYQALDKNKSVLALATKYEEALMILRKETTDLGPVCTAIRKWK